MHVLKDSTLALFYGVKVSPALRCLWPLSCPIRPPFSRLPVGCLWPWIFLLFATFPANNAPCLVPPLRWLHSTGKCLFKCAKCVVEAQL